MKWFNNGLKGRTRFYLWNRKICLYFYAWNESGETEVCLYMEWDRKLISDAADIDVGTYSTTIPPYKKVYYLRYKTRKSHWKLATNETRITCCELRQQHLAERWNRGIHWNAQLRIYFPIQFPPRLLGTSVVFHSQSYLDAPDQRRKWMGKIIGIIFGVTKGLNRAGTYEVGKPYTRFFL